MTEAGDQQTEDAMYAKTIGQERPLGTKPGEVNVGKSIHTSGRCGEHLEPEGSKG